MGTTSPVLQAERASSFRSGSVHARLQCLRAALYREPYLSCVPRGTLLRWALTVPALTRWRVRRGLAGRGEAGEYRLWQYRGYVLAWPRNAPHASLVAALTELSAPGSGHHYFAAETPVRPGDVVVDVGSCEGSFALECLVNRRAARVYCFEPSPVMARALELARAANGLRESMVVVPAAVGATSGRVSFAEDPGALASQVGEAAAAAGEETVAMVTLDEWAAASGLARLDYLKVDAEGSDLDVLRGGEAVLRRFRPRIAVTAYHRPEHGCAITAYLAGLGVGYRCRIKGAWYHDGRVRPVMVHARA